MKRVILGLLGLMLGLGIAGLAGIYVIFQHYASSLPEVSELAVYNPPVVTRVHAGERIIGNSGWQLKRTPRWTS